MNINTITEKMNEFVASSAGNIINAEKALTPEQEDLVIYDMPLIGIASADDPLFSEMKKPDVIGPHFMLPEEWLSGAKSVISVFMPYSDAIKKANAAAPGKEVSLEWLHGRIEGHEFLMKVIRYIESMLLNNGYKTMIPASDPRFEKDEFEGTSNWSERHIAYICGLGTFGLSKGLITKSGTAGRVISIITDAKLTATEREYTEVYEYCNFCGACVTRCPAGAISLEKGKEKLTCEAFVHKEHEIYSGYYGCGKCQTGVPCQSKIPCK